MVARSNPGIDWFDFDLGKLEQYLNLSVPPFTTKDVSRRQLKYVERYAGDLKCKSVAIENHYIDRDHMEDHSVFYSKNLYPYPNHCRRVHFFTLPIDDVKQAISKILEVGIKQGLDDYFKKCTEFSSRAYLGFSTIKPLDGSPVGRTVLRSFDEFPDETDTAKTFRRDFNCTRNYHAHFLGVKLSVRGLGFQQQDVGVSACATTAIWSSLQKNTDHEEITAATPAQITMLAAKYSLPFGRPMPSEGLSADQMCQAVQAIGVSPNLFRIEDHLIGRTFLYSAIKSGFAPVLILEQPSGRHAVTVVGMKLKLTHEIAPIAEHLDDMSTDLLGLYIHDDRLGPYLRTHFAKNEKNQLQIVLPLRNEPGEPVSQETWIITHILIPMHSKIRLTYSGLRHVANGAAKSALGYRDTFSIAPEEIPDPTVTVDAWIVRAHKYVESLFIGKANRTTNLINKLCTTISMARYLGVVRLSSKYFNSIDVLIDSTSTRRNAHCLGVVIEGEATAHTPFMARYLSQVLQCPLVA